MTTGVLAGAGCAMAETPRSPLAERIASRDWSAVERAKQLGAPAAAEAGGLLSHADSDVRFLAVSAVIAADGPDAPRFLLQAALDDDEQVRATAARALLDKPPVGLSSQALDVWDVSRDPTVRYYVSLALGLAADAPAEPIAARLLRIDPGEPVSTSDGLIGALVRRRDRDARRALRGRIEAAQGPRVASILEIFRYVNDASLLPWLRPLLDHREPALDLSDHTSEFMRRACDLAVDEVARLGRLSFQPNLGIRYSQDQIAEAARYLDRLPPPE